MPKNMGKMPMRLMGETPMLRRVAFFNGLLRLRSLPVGSYIVFYRPMEDGIIVIRVLHGARYLPELF
jgi:plasmid stabilization system protein ParE